MARNVEQMKTRGEMRKLTMKPPYSMIGFFHLGQPEHGVCRYGRLLAHEAKKRPDIKVIEHELVLDGDPQRDRLSLIKAAHILSPAHIIHFQFTEEIWGDDRQRFHNLWHFLKYCRCPVIATFHDTEPSSNFAIQGPLHSGHILHWLYQYGLFFRRICKRHIRIALLKVGLFRDFVPSNAWIRYWLLHEANRAFVCTHEEYSRLGAMTASGKVAIIPHFVEERTLSISREKARKYLGLDHVRVITLLGFIYGGKGHEILLKALSLLPDDMWVIFAGGPCKGTEAFLEHLVMLARKLGVFARLRITGYLPEPEMEQYLMATDLAVCPYSVCFASGSLSTWISVERPILASALPQFREYNDLEPGAIQLFFPYTDVALAESILKAFKTPLLFRDFGIARLRERLSLKKIFDKHLEYYNASLANPDHY